MEAAQDLIRDAPTSMVVTFSDPKLAIAAADGRTRTLYSDKRRTKTANGNAEVQAHWDADRLVAETKFGSLKVVEVYMLASNGEQLIVTAKLDAPSGGRGERPTMELRRVYDRLKREDTSRE